METIKTPKETMDIFTDRLIIGMFRAGIMTSAEAWKVEARRTTAI